MIVGFHLAAFVFQVLCPLAHCHAVMTFWDVSFPNFNWEYFTDKQTKILISSQHAESHMCRTRTQGKEHDGWRADRVIY